MRIAMVSEHASPLAVLGGVDAGGQNVHVADLARALGRLGAEVVVHTRRDDPALPRRVQFAPNVTVDHVDAGPAIPVPKDRLLPFMPAFARELSVAWRRDRPDVVHSHFWMSGLAALWAARPLELPLAHTYHALGVVKRRNQGRHDTSPPARMGAERMLAGAVDRVVATTADEAFELAQLGADLDRITVVPCGVDLAHFRPEGPVEVLPPGRRRVVVLSRLVERKGIGNVIAALAEVPGVELVVAGGPPAGMVDDDVEAQRFRAMATSLGVADRVELLGAVSREHVPALLRSADVVACCPWYEPFGLVAVEAMACGVPVVASAVGGLGENVVDGVTGLLVPPRQPRRIAEALAAVLGDDERRRAMGMAGRRRAERFGWERVAEQTLEVATELALAGARTTSTSAEWST
ncbi:MAG TPA: glycosyltransferase [Acidimicrobiales bacterium]|nr:glycosyltransferase [Acidimicrobiales bacterium]